MIYRANTSEISSKMLPSNPAYGIIHRWSIPTTQRVICGMTIPINPIGPATATAPPERRIIIIPRIIFI